jgi:hypothetical protein
MSKELKLLNFICVVVALGFMAMAVISVLLSGDFLTTDNLFIIVVCLTMALLFAINPLLYLHSQGRLPVPFMKRSLPAQAAGNPGQIRATTPPLLDAKGRAVPPDVRAMMARMSQPQEAPKP